MSHQRLDFKAIKQAADFAVILERTGVQAKREGAELVAHCPFHDDKRPSLRVNPQKGLFHCFGCGQGGNALDFVARKERLTIKQAAERLAEWSGIAPSNGFKTSSPATPKELETPRRREESSTEESNRPLTFRLKLDPSHPYLESRRVKSETIAHFGLGYCGRGMMAGRICIPMHNEEGELVAYAGRYAADPGPESESKYLLPSGFKKGDVVFNLHRVSGSEHLTLVEGYFSIFRLFELGIPSVALMGSTLSDRQQGLLARSGATHLSLFLDGDDAGRQATAELLPRLAGSFFVRDVYFGPNTQPDTLPEAKLSRLTKEASCQ